MAETATHVHAARHFGRLAGRYDQAHHRYNMRTLGQALEALRLEAGQRLLDVGCGTGEFERLVREQMPQATLVGIDVTPEMLAVARGKFAPGSGVVFAMGQAEALPVASASVDTVVSCNMLHHVPTAGALLRECARVLRPQGRLILIDWSRDFWHCRAAHYWLRLVKRSYVTMYRSDELIALSAPLGLAVDTVKRFFVPPYFGMVRIVATKREASLDG